MERTPLVSVAVTTYNSSKYVLETLESIKAQTYQNIELIVSDDCSTDNTVAICKDWIEKNAARFVRTQLLESPINTGVSGNGNRARNACNGEWIKDIAGDDLLMPHCVETYIRFVDENRDAQFIFARLKAFGDNETFNELYNTGKVFDYSFFCLPAKQQYERMIFHNAHLPAPTFFYNRKAFSVLGVVNDERIPYAEDEAKWLNMLKKGARFYFVDEYTVRYRVGHPEALSSNGGIKRNSVERYKSNRAFNLLYKFPDQYALNPDEALNKLIELEARVYGDYYNMAERYDAINSSYAYKIGKIIMKPFSFVRHKILRK